MELKVLNGFSRVTPEDLDQFDKVIESRTQKIGFDRIYDENDPERGALLNGKIQYSKNFRTTQELKNRLQGFSRVNYENTDLQGLSLQGQTILNGYSLGTAKDLEEWDHLLNIEHPIILNGFPSFVLNGKAERKAKRAERKAEKQETKSSRPKAQKRAERKAGAQDRKQRKKEVRVAKKEEKLLKKIAKREDRTAKKQAKSERKQSRIDEKTKRRELREESKRLKAQLRADKSGRFAEIFGEALPGALETAVDLVRGEGDFRDFTAGDFDLPAGVSDYVDQAQKMDPEDLLDQREEMLEEIEEIPGDEESEAGGAPGKKSAVKVSNKGLLFLGLAGLGAMAMSKKKKKKK